MSLSVEIFDQRRCLLGEGPTVTGVKNNRVQWVDILQSKVLWRDLDSGEIGEYSTPEVVSFAIPRKSGGDVLGMVGGPHLRNLDGTLESLQHWEFALSHGKSDSLRWNDAKVSPTGELWLGTMASDGTGSAGGLFAISADGKSIIKVLDDISISNGLDWSPDGSKFYFIDTLRFRLDVFDVKENCIVHQKVLCVFNQDHDGYPDGLTVDAEGFIWIAFWNGRAVRRYSPEGRLVLEIAMPVNGPTSCAFVGDKLEKLVITTAKEEVSGTDLSGMTFIVETGIRGKRNGEFSV
jgi:sugar lactone lactonase YvrE